MMYLSLYKNDFVYENYINIVKSEKYRKELTRFRLSSHSLYIETGRYENIGRENRICTMCSQNVVESEFHFLLCCTAYSALRTKYNIKCNWPSHSLFKSVMSNRNERYINNLAKYVYFAMKLRKDKLQELAAS